MASKRSGLPDPAAVAAIRHVISMPKTWVAAGEMNWIDAGGKPMPGFGFRERLTLPDGSQPAGLFVACYFKASSIHGSADKLSLGLHVNHMRVIALDENGPGGHFNDVGEGRPHFRQRVGFPHVHTVSDDGIEGYAEPLNPMAFEGYWDHFVAKAGIIGAPPFELPTLQLGLLP